LVVKIEPTAKTYREAAKEQDKEDREIGTYAWMLRFGGFNVALTVIIGIIAGLQARYMWQTNAHVRIVERPRLSVSHQPPGVVQRDQNVFVVSLKISNGGHTAARITKAEFFYTLSDNADTGLHLVRVNRFANFPPTFLRPEDHFESGNLTIPITDQDLRGHYLRITGKLHYTDDFGYEHVSGYGRRHRPHYQGNNLILDGTVIGDNFEDAVPPIRWYQFRRKARRKAQKETA